ncbi:MAG: hypothetical protein Q4G43_11020, partial [Mobilicoccus sp.]|nr:hypothetical protein [Mobilicoccus sp.]
MNTDDLFDRIASELAGLGAVEDEQAPTRTLLVDGHAFARLTDSGAEVHLPEGEPARADALDRWTTVPSGGPWIAVPEGDSGQWPRLF